MAQFMEGIIVSDNSDGWRSWVGPADLPQHDNTYTVEVNQDVKLHCFEYGKDNEEVVLVMHGGLGSSEDFGSMIPALVDSFRIIAVDTRGHGRSSDDDQGYGYRLFADDMIAVLDQLGIKSTHTVGWSDGANTSMQLAIHYPDRVGRIVAIGGNTTPEGLRASVLNDHLIHAMVGASEIRYKKIAPNPDNWEKFQEKVVHMWMNSDVMPEEDLAKISSPILVSAGVYEEGIDENHTKWIAEKIPSGELWLIDNASHFAMWQDVEGVNSRTLSFLKGLPAEE